MTKNYKVCVNRRTVTHKNVSHYVYDVWSMLDNTTWQSVANAMSPRLIKEFFGIEIL